MWVRLTGPDLEAPVPAGAPGVELSPAAMVEVQGGAKYEVEQLLARGGMGLIYAAKDLHCDRTVAIKVLQEPGVPEEENRRRFVGEARITSKLEHPNIVPIHELGRDVAGRVFYTMKYIRGVTLADILNGIRRGDAGFIEQYPLRRLLTVFQKTCDALAFAHSRGVVHRDLKPANIMIGDYGEVLVLDWGLARQLPTASGAGAPDADSAPVGTVRVPRSARARLGETFRFDTAGTGLKTVRGTVMGTPGFMAPEQVRGNQAAIDVRTDIYALGALLYSILALQAPVTGKKIPELLRRILSGDIRPPASFNPPADAGAASRAFPHCPGDRIPEVLSEAAMKALAVDPAERYRSVPELQAEIEAFQNGMVWHLIVDEDFSNPDIGARWEVMGAHHEIVDGELRLWGGELHLLLLKRDLPEDIRLEFECRIDGAYLNDVGCLLSAIRSDNAWETSVSGYAFKYGAYTNTLNVLTRLDRRLWAEPASPLVSGKTYRVRVERIGGRLTMWVNNQEICSVVDPDPLSGSSRTTAGILGWIADTRYRNIRIYSLGAPWKSDLLDVAERTLRRGRYATAKDLFQEVLNSFPDTARQERARQGFEVAQQYDAWQRDLPGWRARLEQAWPLARPQIRIDSEGLTVEIPNAGIENLAPLAGIPVQRLVCWGNRISDLSPLRGMPLQFLNCAGNPVSSLEPLRGMPLAVLLCEHCRITDLDPLRGAPLKRLNCAENRLRTGLDALRGMPLEWLNCWATGIESLDPLQGLPLYQLHCDANRIESLEPLRGAPLTEITCGGNRISRLDPLRGCPLNTIQAPHNRIRSLAPLRSLLLSTIHVQCNQIDSLEPLRGMALTSLMCGGNRIRDVAPFVKNPPKTFLFDCDTIPDDELQFLRETWERDFRFAEYAQAAEVLLAVRKRDVGLLRRRAAVFGGHRYLFIPKFLEWSAARALCRELGGHMVSITSAAENEFAASLLPYGGYWFWIGLNVVDGRPEWDSGEPVEYRAFVSVLQETAPGPRVLAGQRWNCELVSGARNPFMIEWPD